MRIVIALLACLLAAPASAVTIDWVPVGDPGNAPDTATNCFDETRPPTPNCGSVADPYLISQYEVTNAQYAEFLNAVAITDTFGLYNPSMSSDASGGITRSGNSGSYSYAVKNGQRQDPVVYLSWFDALRFANWLHNGQPAGPQAAGTTETGAYTFSGATTVGGRNQGAITFLPSNNEWYKAAYFDGTSYFDFPAGSNAVTACSAPTAAPNSANCGLAVGNVTDVGAYTGSASPYGTFDQGGNVREWTEQIPIDAPEYRTVRGGDWFYTSVELAASYPLGFEPAVEARNIGFRVASLVPEPGTSLLVMTGLAGLAARRRM